MPVSRKPSEIGKRLAVRAVGEEGRPDSENKALTPTPDALYMRVALGGSIVLFLIDTGAAVTCINSRHPAVKSMRWSDPTVVLTTASGADLACLGESKVKLQLGGKWANIRIRKVRNLAPTAILGADVIFQGSITKEKESYFFVNHGGTKIPLLRADEISKVEREEIRADDGGVSPLIKKSLKTKKRPPVLPEPRRKSRGSEPTKLERKNVQTQTVSTETGTGTITFFEKPHGGVRAKKQGGANIGYGEQLNENQRELVKNLVQKYRDCFANNDAEVGRTGICEFNLHTTGRLPAIWKRSQRTAEVEKESLRKQLRTLLDQKIIRKSSSAWSSRPIMVPKKDGSLRLVIGYEAVNGITLPDGFELPLVDEAVNRLGKSKFFAKLDMASAYHQIPIAEESRHKTAFSAEGEHYEYCCVAFGLKNAPAGFARVAARVLNELIEKGEPITLFFDDIVVGGQTFNDHLRLLEEVLRRLDKAGLVLKSTKCKIGLEETECLGFIIDADGAKTDPEKVRAILEFRKPADVKGLRAFLGMINFYGAFVPDMQRGLKPLHEVCGRKNEMLNWTSEMEQTFKDVKEKFTHAMKLARPDFTRKFVITTDASLQGAAAILSQVNEKGVEVPIQCWSKAFVGTQNNWSTTDEKRRQSV